MTNTANTLLALVQALIRKTSAGELVWRQPGATGTYYLRRRSGSVIVESIDQDDAHPFRLTILDNDDNEVERVESSHREPSEWNDPLRGLYVAASKSASQATIAALLADVTADDPPF